MTRALKRYKDDELQLGDGDHRLATETSLFESLVWIHSLNEQLRNDHASGKGAFDSHKEATYAGRLVDGLRFARNSYLHHSLVSVRNVEGIVFPVRFSFRTSSRLAWQPLSHAAQTARRDDGAAHAYSTYLVHADVLVTLNKGRDWLLQQCT